MAGSPAAAAACARAAAYAMRTPIALMAQR